MKRRLWKCLRWPINLINYSDKPDYHVLKETGSSCCVMYLENAFIPPLYLCLTFRLIICFCVHLVRLFVQLFLWTQNQLTRKLMKRSNLCPYIHLFDHSFIHSFIHSFLFIPFPSFKISLFFLLSLFTGKLHWPFCMSV